MTAPVDRALPAFYNMEQNTWDRLRQHEKDTPKRVFLGHTLREVLIDFTENGVKKLFGQDILGKLAMLHLSQPTLTDVTVIPGIGFDYEAMPIIDYFGIDNCILVSVQREGCTFEGDSRSYWTIPGLVEHDFHNKYNKATDSDLFEAQVRKIFVGWPEIQPN